MSTVNINGATLGNNLQALLTAQDIQPGDDPSYEVCKAIYSYHPLGGKLADYPIAMAQSQQRKISVPKGPEERLVEAFEEEWKRIGADKHIFNLARLSRIYGVASVALLAEDVEFDQPVDFTKLADAEIAFNVFDPLNTAGSLVLNQNPSALDFQKVTNIAVQGRQYHRSRTVTLLNEDPIYIEYTTSAFGYVGRSVYQRAFFQLKSYINTLITDDLIAIKSGVLIAKLHQQSSVVDQLMANVAGQKRTLLKEAAVGNVLSIATEESIESLDLKNLDGAYGMARKHIIENIASASSTPSKILLSETFAEGFGEGTEDAKHVAQFINRLREWMEPAYSYFDKIVRYRAWNEEFYQAIQNEFPEQYGKMPYNQAFYEWSNSFTTIWPSLIEEPESEKIRVADVQLRAVIAMVEVMLPQMDPDNKAILLQWACDNFNSLKNLFGTPLEMDFEALKEYTPPEQAMAGEETKEPHPPKPFADSEPLRELSSAIARLPARKR